MGESVTSHWAKQSGEKIKSSHYLEGLLPCYCSTYLQQSFEMFLSFLQRICTIIKSSCVVTCKICNFASELQFEKACKILPSFVINCCYYAFFASMTFFSKCNAKFFEAVSVFLWIWSSIEVEEAGEISSSSQWFVEFQVWITKQ